MRSKIAISFPFSVLVCMLLAHCAVPLSTSLGPGGGESASGVRLGRTGLVEVRTVIPDAVIDLRYATANNVAGKKLYPSDLPCLLRASTARKLALAQEYLRVDGYGIKVWDAYRPPKSHLGLWEASKSGAYVTPPSVSWSKHCAGVAVDLTLVDSQGKEVAMPTKFDHFSPRASSTYRGTNPKIARNLEVLQRAMRRAGFSTISNEWWHFNEAGAGLPKVVTAKSLGIELPNHVRNLTRT